MRRVFDMRESEWSEPEEEDAEMERGGGKKENKEEEKEETTHLLSRPSFSFSLSTRVV